MIKVNFNKAKDISHDMRRAVRAEEFAPLDEIIAKKIPGYEEAEAARKEIRERYALIQNEINECECVDSLKAVLIEKNIINNS